MKSLVGRTLRQGEWAPMSLVTGKPDIGWYHVARHLHVVESEREYDDGRVWHHVSACVVTFTKPLSPLFSDTPHYALPSWEDMAFVKDAFIGDKRTAYMVAPPREQYVNDHATVLHWWSCLDEDAILPDFRIKAPDGRWTI